MTASPSARERNLTHISGFRQLLSVLNDRADNAAEKGHNFEQVVKAFLQQDKALSAQYDEVWLWSEWEGNQNQHDIGIDLVRVSETAANM